MTDLFEDGNYLVRVRAQVMSRDDSSGGWVPLGGGGLSNVSVRKRPRPSPSVGPGGGSTAEPSPKPKHDYLIYGKRISDQSIVLSCIIRKDFEYNKVMPTFHHWKTGDKKFGLTFQTAADARAFDKGVRTAVEDLLDGFAETSPLPPLHKYAKDVGDDDVFMTLNLPQEPRDSRSSSDSSTKGGNNDQCSRRDKPASIEGRSPNFEPVKGEKGENYSYVQLTAVHEYIYPMVGDDQSKSTTTTGGGGNRHHHHQQQHNLKKYNQQHQQQQQQHELVSQPSLLLKGGGGGGGQQMHHKKSPPKLQFRCRYCTALYTEDANPKGSCEYSPDPIRTCIDKIACIECAQCACYHCAADAEGDFAQHPCDCSATDEGGGANTNCTKRWFCLTMLSVLVPCLWLYPPLKLCHWCGVRCGWCGGRHSVS